MSGAVTAALFQRCREFSENHNLPQPPAQLEAGTQSVLKRCEGEIELRPLFPPVSPRRAETGHPGHSLRSSGVDGALAPTPPLPAPTFRNDEDPFDSRFVGNRLRWRGGRVPATRQLLIAISQFVLQPAPALGNYERDVVPLRATAELPNIIDDTPEHRLRGQLAVSA